MPDTTVKVFQNTDAGVPALSRTAGTLISVLDACLVNGYGSVTLDSLVVESNIATCTKSTGHGFTAIGPVRPVIRIAGSTPSGLNGDWRITVVSSTAFTFATNGIGDQTATGTITAKRAPAGFSQAFSDTQRVAYRSNKTNSLRLYLYINDTTQYSAGAIGYESMTDIDTGNHPFPASSNYAFCKASSSNPNNVPWVLIADDCAFYLHVDFDSSPTWYYAMQFFGDIITYGLADLYHCLLARGINGAGGTAPSAGQGGPLFAFGEAGLQMPRSYTQADATISVSLDYNYNFVSNMFGRSSVGYPDAVAQGLLLIPIEVTESASVIRGRMPGFYAPKNSFYNQYLFHKSIVSNVTGFGDSGRDIMLLAGSARNGAVAFDVTGPWR